jgi:hypothetical protein
LSYTATMQQWREGARRLEDAPREQRRILDRVTERIYSELRRRLGSSFSIDELVDLYEEGTDWALQLAMSAAPGDPWAWEPRIVVDGAFAQYVREATDYAGGRRISPDG